MNSITLAKAVTLLSVGILTGCPSVGEDGTSVPSGSDFDDPTTELTVEQQDSLFNDEASDLIKEEVERIISQNGLTGSGARVAVIGSLNDAHSASAEITDTGVSGAYRSKLQTAEATISIAEGIDIDFISNRDSREAENDLRDYMYYRTDGEDTHPIPNDNISYSGTTYCSTYSLATNHLPNASVEFMRSYPEAEDWWDTIDVTEESSVARFFPLAAHAANEGVDFITSFGRYGAYDSIGHADGLEDHHAMIGYTEALQNASDNDSVIVFNYGEGLRQDLPEENIENLLIVTDVEWDTYAGDDGAWEHTEAPYNPNMPNVQARTVVIPRVELIDCNSTAQYIHSSKEFADIRYTATVLLAMLKETYPQLSNEAVAQIVLDTATTNYASAYEGSRVLKFINIEAALAIDPNDYL